VRESLIASSISAAAWGTVHLSSSENHSCMKFLAEDFNGLRHVACFKMVNHQTIFKNGIHARFLVKLSQQAIIIFRRNVDQNFHGVGLSNPPKLSIIAGSFVVQANRFDDSLVAVL
jgi:hypothetical protein